jgi:hypothetical protein
MFPLPGFTREVYNVNCYFQFGAAKVLTLLKLPNFFENIFLSYLNTICLKPSMCLLGLQMYNEFSILQTFL